MDDLPVCGGIDDQIRSSVHRRHWTSRRRNLRRYDRLPSALADGWQVRPADVDASHRTSLPRSEEHTSELQSLMRISYAVFCLKKKIKISTPAVASHLMYISIHSYQTHLVYTQPPARTK